MSQEMRQKGNRDACAAMVRQAHQLLIKASQDTQDLLSRIGQAQKLIEEAQKLADAQPVPGSRKQPAPVRAKLARAAAVLQKLEADIRAVPVTGLEKAVATKQRRDRRRREERIPPTLVPTPPKKAKRKTTVAR